MDLFLTHCTVLVWLTFGAATRLQPGFAARLATTAGLTWANLTLTELLLSLSGIQGNPASASILSCLLGAVVLWISRGWKPTTSEPEVSPHSQWLLVLGALLTLIVACLAAVQVNIPDAVSPQGPTTAWLLSVHPGARQALNLLPLFGWCASLAAGIALARHTGASLSAAAIASLLLFVSVPALAETHVPGDAYGALAVLLSGGLSLMQWRDSGLRRDGLLGLGLITLAVPTIWRSMNQVTPDPEILRTAGDLWNPISRPPTPLFRWDESTAAFGWEAGGALVLLVAYFLPGPKRSGRAWLLLPAGLLAVLAIVIMATAGTWRSATFLPAVAMGIPIMAQGLDRLSNFRSGIKYLGLGLTAAAMAGATWSAALFAWHNTSRPLAPLLDRTIAGPATNSQLANTPQAPAHGNDPQTAKDAHYIADLIGSRSPGPDVEISGLLPVEGPYPHWRLPEIRWSRAEVTSIRCLMPPGTTRLRISLGARLQVRHRGILEVVVNGTSIRQVEFNYPFEWREISVETPASPGTVIVELRDALLPPEPDWDDYLDRYQDVRRHVERLRQPRSQGAREHYTYSGRAEGRTVRLVQPPRPARDAYRFIFRELRIEGLKQ